MIQRNKNPNNCTNASSPVAKSNHYLHWAPELCWTWILCRNLPSGSAQNSGVPQTWDACLHPPGGPHLSTCSPVAQKAETRPAGLHESLLCGFMSVHSPNGAESQWMSLPFGGIEAEKDWQHRSPMTTYVAHHEYVCILDSCKEEIWFSRYPVWTGMNVLLNEIWSMSSEDASMTGLLVGLSTTGPKHWMTLWPIFRTSRSSRKKSVC